MQLGNRVTVEERRTETDGTEDSSEVEESTTRGGARMQENASYQPSTNFDFATNPAYVIGVAIIPEIPTEDNVAYMYQAISTCAVIK